MVCRWPYRQIRGLTVQIHSVEVAASNEALSEAERALFREHIQRLKHSLSMVLQDPNTTGRRATTLYS